MPQEVILGEAERVSENLSDAQCYKKKKRGEREGWREGKERDRGRERGENKKKKIQGTIYISMASPDFI